jgi:hypothetical protein
MLVAYCRHISAIANIAEFSQSKNINLQNKHKFVVLSEIMIKGKREM